jgi:hypothetical protein
MEKSKIIYMKNNNNNNNNIKKREALIMTCPKGEKDCWW